MIQLYLQIILYVLEKKHSEKAFYRRRYSKIMIKIKDEKIQYNINREAKKISALPPRKTEKYEFLTGEETLPSNQK